jgi:hypothetical protein
MKAFLALLAALALLASTAEAGDNVRHGTVVELFTSQGCSSCPPADVYLGELAKRDDLVALTFNVDYWDYLGWKDTLADPAYTQRQRAYAAAMRDRGVYTPEMVIGGRTHAVGSNRAAVMAEVEKVRRQDTQRLHIGLSKENGHVVVRLPEGPAPKEATIWLARYDHVQEVPVRKGENGGRTLKYYNVVRELTNLGLWRGEAKEIAYMADELAKGGRTGCAVIVQQGSHGPILGAAAIDFGPGS